MGPHMCPQISLSAAVTTTHLPPPWSAPTQSVPEKPLVASLVKPSLMGPIVRVPTLWVPGPGQVSHRGRGPQTILSLPCLRPLSPARILRSIVKAVQSFSSRAQVQAREPDREQRPHHPPASSPLFPTTSESVRLLCLPLQNKGPCAHQPMTANIRQGKGREK